MIRKTRVLWQRTVVPGLLLSMCALLCAPAWSDGPTLTYEQLQRLLKVIDKQGSRAAIPHDVASVLQLIPAQLAPDVKQAAYLDEDGNRHGFAALNDGSGYFMFRSGPSVGNSVYRVDSTLHLVRAARSLMKNGPLLSLPDAEAQKELDDEFARWSKVLSPNGPVTGPTPFPFKQPAGPAAAPAADPSKRPEPGKP
ncbi:MAG TPA: hypothetical protein VMQ45_10765 [Burkholderiaceae bacterium]|nr:hypothetical protein [Burkholderiaceae bacterium]